MKGNELKGLRDRLDHHLTIHKYAVQATLTEKERVEEAKLQVQRVATAQEELQKLAQIVQQQSHRQIGKVVTRCLSAVFGDLYQLKIEFVRLRGKTEAKLMYLKEGNEVDPLRTSGGVLDVSALALRIADLILSEPQSRKFLALDEPMTGVSAGNMPKVAALIETLSKEMGIQFLLATHNENLTEAGREIRL